MTTGSLCLTEILMSWKSCSANRPASHIADSASASGVALPYLSMHPLVQRAGVDPDPDRGAVVLRGRAAISLTWSSNLRMLPGFTRTAAQPASIAANTYLGWKWMSAITGICDLRRDRRQRVGVVLARAGDPHDVAAGRGELGDLLQGGVDVGGQRGGHRLHRDRVLASRRRPCPTCSCRVFRRAARVGAGGTGMPRETLTTSSIPTAAGRGRFRCPEALPRDRAVRPAQRDLTDVNIARRICGKLF